MDRLLTGLESWLRLFQKCFTRRKAFRWFVVIIVSLMLRTDTLGVTSFVRALDLKPSCYPDLLHFFRADSIKTDDLHTTLCQMILDDGHLYRLTNGRALLIGDGVKVAKEGRYMPAVKKLHQESEDSSKGEWIFGHMYGGVAAVVTNGKQTFATPISLTIQDGLADAAEWKDSGLSSDSHTVRMITNAYDAAKSFGACVVVLDRLFLTVPALNELYRRNSDPKGAGHLLEIVTRAKNNCIAYEEPPVHDGKKRGRPRKKGAAVKLMELFDTRKDDFTEAEMSIYGKERHVRLLSVQYLWGQKLYKKLQFVLAETDGTKGIFVSTDLSLSAAEVIGIYEKRFKIETMFRQMKQECGTFGYHFWTKAQPKLNRFAHSDAPSPFKQIDADDTAAQKRILSTLRAT